MSALLGQERNSTTRRPRVTWQQGGIVFAHADMSGASCCQRLIRPAIAAQSLPPAPHCRNLQMSAKCAEELGPKTTRHIHVFLPLDSQFTRS